LRDILRDRIACGGPLGFPEFMAAALYEPGLGYYARDPRPIGRHGDFFTSVSVGPLFGELLARRFLRHWHEAGQPDRWRIIECGAHDGSLAADVLAALARLEPRTIAALEYAIPEPLENLHIAQRRTLASFGRAVRLLRDPHELAAHPLPGIAFGNEVLDALPCHIVEWRAGRWLECRVGLAGDAFAWETAEITDPDLLATLAPVSGPFPDGYRTEVRSGFREFLAPLVRALDQGLMLWLDYGFERADFHHPARSRGTLRTFTNHRSGEDPLAAPGEEDITAHVDFTALAEAAASLGGRPSPLLSQGAWLTGNAREWLLAQEGNPDAALLRQFQTLTHPAHLGRAFHVLKISWQPPAD
jgi:SAM-dependent MidA family methyltransferase